MIAFQQFDFKLNYLTPLYLNCALHMEQIIIFKFVTFSAFQNNQQTNIHIHSTSRKTQEMVSYMKNKKKYKSF